MSAERALRKHGHADKIETCAYNIAKHGIITLLEMAAINQTGIGATRTPATAPLTTQRK